MVCCFPFRKKFHSVKIENNISKTSNIDNKYNEKFNQTSINPNDNGFNTITTVSNEEDITPYVILQSAPVQKRKKKQFQ